MTADTTPDWTEDRLLDGRLRLFQPVRGYRAAVDPVLLAAAVPAAAGESVLDLGTGVGTAALCLAHRAPGAAVTGLEIQPALAAAARRGVAANALGDGFGGRVRIVTGDLRHPPADLGTNFDQVMANPPYQSADHGHPPEDPSRALANVEGDTRLAHWLDAALDRLRPKGRLTLVHRADRLDEILAGLWGRAGEVVVFPLWPAAGRPARRVLVAARKGVRAPLRLAPGLVLHEADGAYTAAAQAILRDGAALVL